MFSANRWELLYGASCHCGSEHGFAPQAAHGCSPLSARRCRRSSKQVSLWWLTGEELSGQLQRRSGLSLGWFSSPRIPPQVFADGHSSFDANRNMYSACPTHAFHVERYAFSGVAFTSAKGLDLEWCKAPDAGLPSPDLLIHMELSQAEAESRGGFGDERYEVSEFQTAVKGKVSLFGWMPGCQVLAGSTLLTRILSRTVCRVVCGHV